MGTATAALATAARTEGPANGYADGSMVIVPFTITMSASYATGGDTVVLPSDIAGLEILALVLQQDKSGANRYSLAGTQSAPLVQAFSAFNSEVSNATNLSAVTLRAVAFCQR